MGNVYSDECLGIPAFDGKGLWLKQLISGAPCEMLIFFNYKNLEDEWATIKNWSGKKKEFEILGKPHNVETFNL